MDRTEHINEQTPESSRFDRETIASVYSRLLQIEKDTWDIYMDAGRKLHVTENELWILLKSSAVKNRSARQICPASFIFRFRHSIQPCPK